jgi:hypothetical protein
VHTKELGDVTAYDVDMQVSGEERLHQDWQQPVAYAAQVM